MKLFPVMLAAAGALGSSFALSLAHPWGNPRSEPRAAAPLLDGNYVPNEARRVMETKCADCHSTNTRWPFYSRFAPVSWLIEHDVIEGRNHLDFSKWQQYSRESQIDLLTKIASESRSGQMPLRQYVFLHPETRLSTAEQQLLYDWARTERKRIRQQVDESHAAKP